MIAHVACTHLGSGRSSQLRAEVCNDSLTCGQSLLSIWMLSVCDLFVMSLVTEPTLLFSLVKAPESLLRIHCIWFMGN